MSSWHNLRGKSSAIAVNLARAISIEPRDAGCVIHFGNGDHVTVENTYEAVIKLAGVVTQSAGSIPHQFSEKDPFGEGIG